MNASLPQPPESFPVVKVRVHVTTLADAATYLEAHARARSGGSVIFRDVHGIVRCEDDPALWEAHQNALLVCPDGMPIVRIGQKQFGNRISRTYGPDFMRHLFEVTSHGQHRHFLFGGNEGVAEELKAHLQQQYPNTVIAGTDTPPFRPLHEEEWENLAEALQTLKVHYCWVGLGTPKQELFMEQARQRIPGVIFLGVGAAFDYLSGQVAESPDWIKKAGLQWLHRALQEPGRLGKRYAVIVPRFLFLRLKQRLGKPQG